jgi:hypothetical protein
LYSVSVCWDRLADITRLHGLDQADEGRRDGVVGAPADVAAIERVLRVGVADRGGAEGEFAAADDVADAFDLALGSGDLLGRRAVRQRDHDVGQANFGAADGALGQQLVDLGLADLDAALDVALAQAFDQHLLAQAGAEFLVAQSIRGQSLAQLVRGHAVARRDALDRLGQLRVADADAGFRGTGELQTHQHQAVEHLAFEHVPRRQLAGLAGVLGDDVLDRAVELAAKDHVLVDHGGDAVEGGGRLGGRRDGRRGETQDQQAGQDGVDGVLHAGSGSGAGGRRPGVNGSNQG